MNDYTDDTEARISQFELHEQISRDKIAQAVENQTKPHGTSLCFRCQNSLIYRSKKEEFSPVIVCSALGGQHMPPDIIECSSFTPQNKLSLLEMSGIAKPLDFRDPHGHYL